MNKKIKKSKSLNEFVSENWGKLLSGDDKTTEELIKLWKLWIKKNKDDNKK